MRRALAAFAMTVLGLALVPLMAGTRVTRPSIVLISVDTLRADHLGVYGYDRHTSPFLDSIARDGTVFDDVVVPLPTTDPSHAALLTGLHPLRTGMVANAIVLPDRFETLAEVLLGHGYHTAAATGVYHLAARYGFGQGFERFTSVSQDRIRRPAVEVNRDAIRILREYAEHGTTRPLFLFVHYFDVHAPYVNHEHPGNAPGEPSQDWMVDAYDSGIRFVDAQIRDLWTAIEAAQLPGGVLLAVTADHGEQLGDHRFLGGHADIYQETIRVPLILYGPGVPRQHVPDAVSSMDLAPTLLDRAGLHFTAPTDGRSLEPVLKGEAVDPERPLLVLGYPMYARSVAVRQGSSYFLRNLEWVYRDVTIEPDRMGDGTPAGAAVAAFTTTNHVRRFSIPPIDFRPFGVTARLDARASCPYRVTITLPGGAELTHNAPATGPVQIDYTVARLDSSVIAVQPGECVDSLTWTLTKGPVADPSAPSTTPPTSYLYTRLLTARKDTVGDERYDLTTDRNMTRNLIDATSPQDHHAWRTLLERTFNGLVDADGQVDFSPEERRRLQALGYIPG
jgi:hypothetical protein